MLGGQVLAPGSSTDWDSVLWSSGPGSAVKVGDTYYLYYNGSGDYIEEIDENAHRAIGVATSTDGVNWTKYSGNPVVTYGPSNDPTWAPGEGAVGPVVLHDGTWHMWYGAVRYTGAADNEIDVDIRYRSSANGLDWANDTLVYQSVGNEVIPLNALTVGDTYYLYYAGPLRRGAGALRVMSGPSPTSLSGTTQVAAGPFRGSHGMTWLEDGETLAMHVMGEAFGTVFVYQVDKDSATRIGREQRHYRFVDYGGFSILLDGDTWRMFQLDLTTGPHGGTIIQRTATMRPI